MLNPFESARIIPLVMRVLTIVGLIGGACCLLQPTSAVDTRAFAKPVTFTKDVAPVFFNHCAECHRPNDIAPFSVLTYKDVRPWARSIREKVITREMPPWHPDPRYGDFANDPSLNRNDIATISAWVDQGAKEGDPKDLPPLPDFIDGWRIGKPDRVLQVASDYIVEPDAPDAYAYFTFPTRFKEDRWIQAAEIRPGNRRLVHHAIAHVITPQAIAKARGDEPPSVAPTENEPSIFYNDRGLARARMDAPVIDDGAGSPNGGALFRRRTGEEGNEQFSVLLTSYAPGKGPDVYEPGSAKRLPAGSTIVLQVHYSSYRGALRKPEKDRTSVGLVFAKAPPDRQVMTLTVQNHFFKIPAGAENHQVTASYTLDRDVELIDYMPHMHLRGKDMKYEAISPDGRRQTLLSIPKFSFNWQTVYRLKSPIRIDAGSRIIVTAHFDNSAKNKYNPDPTKAVRWGDPTYDEMMIGWMEYATPASK